MIWYDIIYNWWLMICIILNNKLLIYIIFIILYIYINKLYYIIKRNILYYMVRVHAVTLMIPMGWFTVSSKFVPATSKKFGRRSTQGDSEWRREIALSHDRTMWTLSTQWKAPSSSSEGTRRTGWQASYWFPTCHGP